MQEIETDNRKPRVLVVDDSRANLAMLSNLLEGDAEIVTAPNGVVALETARAQPFALILLDVVMPEMDGFEVCRRLKMRKTTAEVPVIFVTALSDELDETHGLSLGAVDYITKPYKPAIIKARVANHLLLRKTTQQLQQANQELARLATTDSLTGICNRRQFFDLAATQFEKCKQANASLSALVLDLDRFKTVNDTHGHDVGDTVLIRTVGVCLEVLEDSSILGRLGGEEFAVLLPGVPLSDAARIAEEMRNAVAEMPVTAESNRVQVTVSIGGATLQTSDIGIEDLLKRADSALYRAKKGGRNRVEADELHF
ncbi:MAG: diguanylate cyclase [bacterium]|nr:diguanylate cyclase [bacterium]